MRYIPATPSDVAAMLSAIGVGSVTELFDTIPAALRLGRALDLPAALSELDLMRECEAMAARNPGASMTSYLGAGAYAHFIPSVVDMVISRSEFATAYTPYQAEVAQGTLQAIFQMQTFVCELLGMDIANASNYEGASSLAEAALMTKRVKRRHTGPDRLVVSMGVNPEYRAVLRTYLTAADMELVEVPFGDDGATDWAAMARAAEGGALGLIVQSPNHLGIIEDLNRHRATCDAVDALMVVNVVEATSLGLLAPPGAFGADIVSGEGQALGISLSFGGPYMGMFAVKADYLRQMPGRLVGQTVDMDGERGYVLTLSTREQHIRREKATSNICTNAGLMALAFTVATALLGKQGLPELARLNLAKATFLKRELARVDGLEIASHGATFNEFAVRPTRVSAATLLSRLEEKGILGGLPLGEVAREAGRAPLEQGILMAVTELHDRKALERTVESFKEAAR